MPLIPKNRAPTPPGEMLLEEFLKPMGLTQVDLARGIGVTYAHVNEIIHGKRRITSETALKLEKFLGVSAESWATLQLATDLYEATHSRKTLRELKRIKPAPRVKEWLQAAAG